MKKSKYTEEQIAFALKQTELGTSVERVVTNRGSHPPDVTARLVLTAQAASDAAAIPRCGLLVE